MRLGLFKVFATADSHADCQAAFFIALGNAVANPPTLLYPV